MTTQTMSLSNSSTAKSFASRFTATMTLVLALFTACPTAGFSLSGFSSSYSGGVSRAKSSNKPLLVVIAKHGCPACEQLEANMSATASALRSAVRVRVEAEENPSLTSRYAGEGTPTILVFTKQNGFSAPVYSYTGVMSSSDLRQLGQSLDALAGSGSSRK